MSTTTFTRGASAGAAGTLALGGLALLRNAVLGHSPPYAARRIAARLVGRLLVRPLSPREALFWSLGMRWLYGPMLGVAWARFRAVLPPSLLARGVLLGAGVWGLEQASFPIVDATPLARTWSRAEHGFLLAQTVLFGLVTEGCLQALARAPLSARPAADEPGRAAPTAHTPSMPAPRAEAL
ncbi:hypothetical protein [Hyalangium gracile]|uniref:hypothetical protein n=1 Tax=Hyalangium gracile TaxID=394092 RepID=UPI001CCFB093|nr:hypothetical protein [Hyalangium gracile]